MLMRLMIGTLAAMTLMFAPAALAHAQPSCTGIFPNYTAYQSCVGNAGGNCATPFQPFALNFHFTCNYPNGGRDECQEQMTPTSTNVTGKCDYVPPGD